MWHDDDDDDDDDGCSSVSFDKTLRENGTLA